MNCGEAGTPPGPSSFTADDGPPQGSDQRADLEPTATASA
jgi:hypothetical protein